MKMIIPFIVLFAVPVLLSGCQKPTEARRQARCLELKHEAVRGARGQISDEEHKAVVAEWHKLGCTRRDIYPGVSSMARYDAVSR